MPRIYFFTNQLAKHGRFLSNLLRQKKIGYRRIISRNSRHLLLHTALLPPIWEWRCWPILLLTILDTYREVEWRKGAATLLRQCSSWNVSTDTFITGMILFPCCHCILDMFLR